MLKKIYKFLFKSVIWLIILSVLWVLLYKWVPVPATPLMAIRYFEVKETQTTKIWKHQWVGLDEISKQIQLAVICSEDQNFIKHSGFDIKAIEKAIYYNKTGKRLRGASTISQQTAKNVFLWPQRSWLRKGLETYFTFLIEQLWSKERIMEVYLNSIEMGNGVYGIQAASQYWFGKSASRLTKDEAAAIASILPNPRNYRANPPSSYIQGRKEWIKKQMVYYGHLSYNESK
ncbi:monofunctional biosynthetic peptidoglycan transglycosylase [Aestuariivivens marinum]|uniref:monofunctional biosynthetic peptidoglycan transglycosylase n=1 Tax=Aestuariivivens marinum TaxID=2913555 RepID=UPI001F5A5C14|nr:monofunctional biosynthetic peptidoglycan transglycosylase [Aestuariivivens marinum]